MCLNLLTKVSLRDIREKEKIIIDPTGNFVTPTPNHRPTGHRQHSLLMQRQLIAPLAALSSRVGAFRSISSRATVVRSSSVMKSACSSDGIQLPKIYSTLDEVENYLQNRPPCNFNEADAADIKSAPVEHNNLPRPYT